MPKLEVTDQQFALTMSLELAAQRLRYRTWVDEYGLRRWLVANELVIAIDENGDPQVSWSESEETIHHCYGVDNGTARKLALFVQATLETLDRDHVADVVAERLIDQWEDEYWGRLQAEEHQLGADEFYVAVTSIG